MEIAVILFLIVLNGLFSMSEIALVSSKRIRLEEKARKGSRGAGIALDLLKEPEKFLSTVQVGITLVGIITGAFGGVALAEDFAPFIARISALKAIAYQLSFVFVVGVITYFSLIIGELVPKTIAFNNPESVAIKFAPFMLILSAITRPIVWFLSISTRVFLKIFMIKPKSEPPVTEDELRLLIEQGGKYGVLETKETEMLKSLLRFGDRRAYTIMTYRHDIVWLDINDSFEDIKTNIYKNNFSVYPVCDGDLENMIGIISVKEYFRTLEKEQQFDIKKIIYQPLYVPENLTAIKLLERFREKKLYLAIVVDEYGSTVGMITLHDLIENIFGYLPGRFETAEEPIHRREDGSLLVDGNVQLDSLRDHIDIEMDEDADYSTLGGYMMYKLNKIPAVGDNFSTDSYRFEVVDMDDRRVDKVMITPIKS